jgi:putative membrane protein
MTSWDLTMDPIWANIVHAWNWKSGGVYFGVPATNFSGWLLTAVSYYLLFALYLRRTTSISRSAAQFRPAVVFYTVSAAGNLLVLLPSNMAATVTDGSGRVWSVAAIKGACVVSTVLTMGVLSAMAWLRLRTQSGAAQTSASAAAM